MHGLSSSFDSIVGFLPRLVAGLLILVGGYLIGALLSRATRAILGRTRYDQGLAKLGLLDKEKADKRAGSRWTGKVVLLVVMLAALMQAARAWNLELLSTGIARVVAYLPHVIGAVLIFGAALYFSNWLRDRMAAREQKREGEGHKSIMASTVRAGILVLGGFMALNELQIASNIVTVAFTVSLAAIALAGALAFGLGSRNVAGQVAQQWYERRPSRVANGKGDVAVAATNATDGHAAAPNPAE
jgi:hypothetical protein